MCTSPAISEFCLLIRILTSQSWQEICQALRQGRSRRAVPIWSARRELWLMAVQQLLVRIRRRICPPVAWNTSQAVLLDKKNRKRGPAAKRIINLLDPLEKGYYKQIWRRAPPRTWHFATGFTHGRRREQGIVQAPVVQHRLRQKGKGYISSSYDVSNAFPSIAHTVLDGVSDYKFVGDTANANIIEDSVQRGLHVRPNGDGWCRAGENACGRNAGGQHYARSVW